jgi:hypothetical protein
MPGYTAAFMTAIKQKAKAKSRAAVILLFRILQENLFSLKLGYMFFKSLGSHIISGPQSKQLYSHFTSLSLAYMLLLTENSVASDWPPLSQHSKLIP